MALGACGLQLQSMVQSHGRRATQRCERRAWPSCSPLTASSRCGWRSRVVEFLALVLLNGHQTCERGCALDNMSAGKASKASEGWRRRRCGGRRARRTGAQPAWRACAATSRRHRTTERRQGQVELEIRQGRNKSWCDHSELPLEHPTTMTPGTTSLWALGRPLTYWPE